ncbi:MAG: DUF790 family protein [bacterium]|nr:DUF790 family protein [bacterium]
MLTADLVQARVYRQEVRPRYIDAEDEGNLALAGELIDVFRGHEGRPRHELDQELKELLGTGTEFLLHRALAKLLLDRSTFDTESEVEPDELRGAVFEAAADAYRAPLEGDDAQPFHLDRDSVLGGVAERLGVEAGQIERGLYADLKDEQILQNWKPCKPDWLLRRYNVALAQGVLFKAAELEIRIDGGDIRQHRELFRKIKFFQLMHRVEGDADSGYVIRLDGPLSVFKSSGRYGLRMASFLPTLLHFDRWSLTARLLWGKKRRELGFRLSPADGLRPHTRLTGQWQPEVLTWLPEQFEKLESEWTISTDAELVDLDGRGVLVPDFVFEHPGSGFEVYMEVFGFWNKGAVASRLELLRRHGPDNLILALSKQLASGREGLGEIPGEIFLFSASPVARKVLKALEELRRRSG